jgi:uncharacterized protein (DUF58 family)
MASPPRRAHPDGRSADPTRIAFAGDFWPRLEELAARIQAARGREPGAAASRVRGAGDEFFGHRPYRPGEELRHLDWGLLARSERAFVRVFRREVGERWVLLLDASASMGLGRPGKLQSAAEIATGLAACGLAAGASARLLALQPGGLASVAAARTGELGRWIAFLEGLSASGGQGLRPLCAAPALARASRVFLLGDLMDLEPADVVPLAARGRSVDLLSILAPHELAPEPPERARGVRWLDPETGASLGVELDPKTAARYARGLEERLSAWDRLARRGRFGHHASSSAVPFEDAVRAVLGSGP